MAPDCAPADLGERLRARGLERDAVRGMARSTAAAERPLAPGVTVEQVTAATVDEFSRTMADGWGLTPYDALAGYNRVLLGDAASPLFLARVDGAAAGTAGLVLFSRSAYFVGAVVLPRFQRHGAYAALSAVRLRVARERGLELATCHARASTSAPLLERLGFERVCDFDEYRG